MSLKTYQKILFAVLSLLYMIAYTQGVVMTVTSPDIMRDMDLTPYRMGLLSSSYLYVYSVSILFSGMLAAWAGPRKTLSIMYAVSGIGSIAFAFAQSLPAALVGRMLTSVGMAVVMTSSFTLFARWYSARVYAGLCAALFSFGGLGAFFGTAPLALLTAAWGWRNVFLLIGIVTSIYAVLAAIVVRDWPKPEDAALIGEASAPGEPVTPARLWAGVKMVAGRWDIWRLTAYFAALSGTYFALAGLWVGPYLRDVHGLSPAAAGGVASMFSIGFVAGNPLLTWFCAKVVRSRRIGMGGAGVVALIGLAVLLGRGTGWGTPALYVLMLVIGMTVTAPNAITYASARSIFGARLAGITSGMMGFSAWIGGAVLQIVCGYGLALAEKWNYSPSQAYAFAFSPFFLCAVVIGVAGFTLSPSADT